ncbi:MAG: hypothetical protein KDI79_08940 [Anaerolineae bacterium]|nr:hypothetical protein [Anaerolineae bacterium]
MATEAQKRERQNRMFNMVIAGMSKGLYDLFGEAAVSVITPIGEEILEEMEHELGLEIHGENPQEILTEIERLLMDEYGMFKDGSLEIHPDTHEVDVLITDSALWHATAELHEAGLPPLACVEMMVTGAALRKRLGRKAKFVGLKLDDQTRTIDIDFHMYDED